MKWGEHVEPGFLQGTVNLHLKEEVLMPVINTVQGPGISKEDAARISTTS